jgi:hypothetical protein
VVCVLADGSASFRDLMPRRAERLFNVASEFVDACLVPANFPCNGTRARLSFFRAQLHHGEEPFEVAAAKYDEAMRLCSARLDERDEVNTDEECMPDVERAFATYCLGKLHVRMGDLEFNQGHLRAAERHLLTAKILLRDTQGAFLANRAELLLCLIARSDSSFAAQGWSLLERIAICREGLRRHPEYYIDASIEEVKT